MNGQVELEIRDDVLVVPEYEPDEDERRSVIK